VTHPPAANLKPSTSPFPLPHMRHTSPANTRAVSQPAVKAIASLLPVPAVPAAQMASLRSPLTRRRSSSPPATSGVPAGGSDTDIGDLQACDLARFDDLTGLGRESDAIGSTGWPSDFAGWGGLLDLGDDDHRPNKGVTGMTLDGPLVSSPAAQPMYRARSDPVLDQRPHHPGFPDSNVRFPSSRAYPSFQAFSPDLIAHFGSDLAWKTILSSVVEVEGVGETSVARLLQEVWKRGGGDAVS